MTSKKSLSEAEKRTRINEIFLSGEFYTFREIEKIATQRKKIVLQSVKEILQSLVDDKLIFSDKIGASVYYWSFPSEAKRMRQAKIKDLEQEVSSLQQRQAELKKLLDDAENDRQDSNERDRILSFYHTKEKLKKIKKQELNQYRDSDPRIFEEKAVLVTLYREAANRVADNIWALYDYFAREFNTNRDYMNSRFGIDENELNESV